MDRAAFVAFLALGTLHDTINIRVSKNGNMKILPNHNPTDSLYVESYTVIVFVLHSFYAQADGT
jgi:hypothetical protein